MYDSFRRRPKKRTDRPRCAIPRGKLYLNSITSSHGLNSNSLRNSLLEDAGSLQDYLGPIKTWIDAHPNEVVTLLLTNPDAIDINKYGDVFKSTGLDNYVFTPDKTFGLDDWPTLGDMISSGKRVVVFMGMSYLYPEFFDWVNGKLIANRLQHGYFQGPVHSRRVRLLLRDSF